MQVAIPLTLLAACVLAYKVWRIGLPELEGLIATWLLRDQAGWIARREKKAELRGHKAVLNG